MQIKTRKAAGFTLVEIMIVVAIIGLLAAIAVPNLVNARTNAQAKACINNLRQIDSAKQQYALENKVAADTTPTSANIITYMGRGTGGSLPVCPAGGTTFADSYTIGSVATSPACLKVPATHKLDEGVSQ
jgi:prepilin-type N-terminal cleavage/methylation domain-containing protein